MATKHEQLRDAWHTGYEDFEEGRVSAVYQYSDPEIAAEYEVGYYAARDDYEARNRGDE